MKRCQKWPSEWHSGKVGKAGAQRPQSWEAECRTTNIALYYFIPGHLYYWLIFKYNPRGKTTSAGSGHCFITTVKALILEFPMFPQGHDLSSYSHITVAHGDTGLQTPPRTTRGEARDWWASLTYDLSSPSGRDLHNVTASTYNRDVCVIDFFLCLTMFLGVSLYTVTGGYSPRFGEILSCTEYCPFKNKSSPSRPLTRLWRLNARVCLLLAPDSQIALVPTPITLFLSMNYTRILITIFFFTSMLTEYSE